MESHPEGGRTAAWSAQQHSVLVGPLGFLIPMAIPAAIAVGGVAGLGFDEIDWPGAIVWGVVATIVFTAFSMMGAAMGMTRMDLLDLLGVPSRDPARRRLEHWVR